MTWIVAALYRFAPVADPKGMAAELRTMFKDNNICGTLILAHEGVNGTIAAPDSPSMDVILDYLKPRFEGVELKMSTAAEKPFGRSKVKIKPEIVTMRAGDINPTKIVGTYVEAQDWDALIADPDVTVIDTRNTFEFEQGTFPGSVDPGTTSFHEFPAFVERALDPKKHKKIAMFCTGGIRCEKASSYMKSAGFEEVYHLKGGILKYLEVMPEDKSTWEGRCFVFDKRVTLGHGLAE